MQLRGLLPDAQLAAIGELPPILATRESAIAVHMAVAQLFLPLARDMSKRTGTPWPDALESALRAHLDSQLSLKLSRLIPRRPTVSGTTLSVRSCAHWRRSTLAMPAAMVVTKIQPTAMSRNASQRWTPCGL